MTPSPDVAAKMDRLLARVGEYGGVAVAFSGGVDSSVVAKAARLALGDRAVAVTADSPSVPRAEVAEAQALAKRIGIRHVLIQTDEFADPDYVKNDGARCFFCKDELYTRIEGKLPELNAAIICSGANLDDLGDYRPGLKAAADHAVRHPLQEAGFTKADVRELARHWNLPTWDKPASPCLSSRLAPGVAVTADRTRRVELAEAFLKQRGFRDLRVRLHEDDLARIEVPRTEIGRFGDLSFSEEFARYLKTLGFRYVTLDLEGFRSGNLNDLIPLEDRRLNHSPTEVIAQ